MSLQPMITMAAEPRAPPPPTPNRGAADLGHARCLEIVRQALSLGEHLDELRASALDGDLPDAGPGPALATGLAPRPRRWKRMTDAGYSGAKTIATLARRLLAHLAAAAVAAWRSGVSDKTSNSSTSTTAPAQLIARRSDYGC